ncbi:MAG: RNA methyltransferase [Aureisphaera sp.]
MDIQLLAYLQSYLTERRRNLFETVLQERTRHFTVVTEDVYQMHNASAVMRSCDVFGIQDLHVIEERLGKRMDREIAMGAQKWVDVHRHERVEDCIDMVKKQGYQIVATTPHNDSCMLQEFDVTVPSAFFFGTEKDGVSDVVMEQADVHLKIPMFGFTESLNISVSAAIILQDVVTRLRKEQVNWQLTEEEILDLKMQWTLRCIKSADKIVARFYDKN